MPILVPLLNDPEVNYIVPWALSEIGEKAAVPPIILMLTDKNPDMRVLAIDALETLRAKEALPELRLLLHDDQRIKESTSTAWARWLKRREQQSPN